MRSTGLRAVLALALAAAAGVLSSFDPPGASAHPGDLVLSKPAAGAPAVGGFATPGDPQAVLGRERALDASATRGGVSAAGAPDGPAARLAARRVIPHYLTKPGSRPAPIIASREKIARGHVDITARARELAAVRSTLGPAGQRRDVTASVPGQDVVRIVLLRVDFKSDRSGASSTGDGRFDLSPRDSVNRPLDPTPHDRAFWQSHGEATRRYWEAQSNGRTVIETVVYPTAPDSAFHLSDMADYGPWKFSPEIYEAAVKLFHDCINAADTTETIPWSTFDRVMIVHAGSDLQSDVYQDSPLDIPTFTLGVPDSDAVVVGPAKADTIFGATILPETIRQDGYEGVVNAVIVHEQGHLIYGYRDVYNVVSGLPVVGYWSLMDVGNLLGNAVTFPSGTAVYATGLLPPSVDPWQKRLIYPDVPAARFPNWGQDESLENSSEGFEVMQVPTSGEEYLLLENRLDDLNGNGSLTLQRDPQTGVILGPDPSVDALEYDFLVPGPGILAWQVDESVADYFGPRSDPGYGLNTNPGRFGLEILEADGLDDLGDFNSPFALGVPTDPWQAGRYSRLNFDTTPRLRTNSRTNPHLDLEFTSAAGRTMSLRVTRQWDLAGWPVRVTQPEPGLSPIVTNIGGFDGEPIGSFVAWTAGDSAVHARTLDGQVPWATVGGDRIVQAGSPLGPVAAVPHRTPSGGESTLLAVARTDAPGGGGRVDVAGLGASAVETSSYIFPSPITAGPTASEDAPDRILVGLASGRVCEIRVDTQQVRDLAGASAQPVTGLALDGNDFAWGDRAGRVGRGRFDGPGPGAALAVALATEPLPAGSDLQPLLLRSAVPGGSPGAYESRLLVVDRTRGSAREVECPGLGAATIEPYQGRELGEAVGPPAIDDVDGDGLPEVVFVTEGGRVGYWNLNGATSPGWPPELEREGFPSAAGPVTLRHPGLSADPILVAPLGNGVTVGLDRAGKNVTGFPLGFSVGTRGTPALVRTGCWAYLFAAGGDTLLYGTALGGQPPECPILAGGPSVGWANAGGTPMRSYARSDPYSPTPIGGGGSAIVDGSLVCYPNPARREPITFAFRLGAPSRVTISVYDAAARLVERIEREGTASDNAITWDPAGRASGLYVARIEAGGSVLTQPFALIR